MVASREAVNTPSLCSASDTWLDCVCSESGTIPNIIKLNGVSPGDRLTTERQALQPSVFEALCCRVLLATENTEGTEDRRAFPAVFLVGQMPKDHPTTTVSPPSGFSAASSPRASVLSVRSVAMTNIQRWKICSAHLDAATASEDCRPPLRTPLAKTLFTQSCLCLQACCRPQFQQEKYPLPTLSHYLLKREAVRGRSGSRAPIVTIMSPWRTSSEMRSITAGWSGSSSHFTPFAMRRS